MSGVGHSRERNVGVESNTQVLEQKGRALKDIVRGRWHNAPIAERLGRSGLQVYLRGTCRGGIRPGLIGST